MTLRAWTLTPLLLLMVCARPGAAQGTWSPRWEIPGYDFSPNGVWRLKARKVAAARRALLAQRLLTAQRALRAQQGGKGGVRAAVRPVALAPAEGAVSGALKVPAILIRFADTDTSTQYQPPSYDTVLFSETPPAGRPYTIRTFYEQMSAGAFSMQGQVLGWVTLSKPEASYTGGMNCTGNPYGTSNCNGIFNSSMTVPIDSLQVGLREALAQLDAQGVDWSQFDNGGIDTVAGSGDTGGYVDMAIFVHPNIDGACGGNNNVWSHRYYLMNQSLTAESAYVTKTPWAGHPGQFIKVRDYTIQSGVGGSSACNGSQIMPIGTAAHESGHGLDLPDLYDIEYASSGIGEWGLMGSGNYSQPFSPSRMEGWSLAELGWVTVVQLTQSGDYSLGPAPTSDTTFLIEVQGSNPRGEYYLLDNREAVLADTALIARHCAVSGNPPNCGGGLLVWHVDSAQIANNGFHVTNLVNYGPVHGVELEQADGYNNLDANPNTAPYGIGSGETNRGDAGDPFPGTSDNTTFGFGTNPGATKNADGSFAGFAIDSIQRLSVNGPVRFRLRFGGTTIVHASDTGAVVDVDGSPYHVYATVIQDTTVTHTVAVADTQYRGDSLVRWIYESWSDGGGITHGFKGTFAGESLIASLAPAFRVGVTAAGPGTVTTTPSPGTSPYIANGTAIQLVAHPAAGNLFLGWSGDTTVADTLLPLVMTRAYTLTANFGLPLTASDVLQELFTGASALTPAQVRYLNALANRSNRSDSTGIDVGSFLAWVRSARPTPPGTNRVVATHRQAGQ
ncbi:MAG TPA: M6 family metalloprotease domain-containing protein [Gemmatimonadales bacterium]|nr:M6 family metalloprotease domain-containing protein [Gemmatimonadales bacterium]